MVRREQARSVKRVNGLQNDNLRTLLWWYRLPCINFSPILRHSSHAKRQVAMGETTETSREELHAACALVLDAHDLLVTQMDTPIKTRAMPASVAGVANKKMNIGVK